MITDKQKQVIAIIEENTGVKFKGESTIEAREFISKHIDESKKVSDHYKELILANFGGHKKVWELLNEETVHGTVSLKGKQF